MQPTGGGGGKIHEAGRAVPYMVPAYNPSSDSSSMCSGTPTARALVIAPTDRELGGTVDGPQWRATAVGIGDASAGALADFLNGEAPPFILSLGFAGALAPGISTGSLTVHTEICVPGASLPLARTETDNLTEQAKATLAEAGIAFHTGPLLTVPRPLLTPPAKRLQHTVSGAIAVDMEGYWLARVAAEANIPLVTIRAILDEAGHTVPPMVEAIIVNGGRNEWRQALRAIFTTTQGPSLVPLALHSMKAKRTLGLAAKALLPDLLSASRDGQA